MTALSSLLIGTTFADDRFAAHQRGSACFCFRRQQSCFDRGGIVPINAWDDLPAIGLKPFRGVVGEPSFHLSINGDPVVIINGNEFAQTERARQRARLMGDALH